MFRLAKKIGGADFGIDRFIGDDYGFGRAGEEVNPDNVLVVPGGKVTMFTAILMFGEPGVEIMYPDPGFPIYRSMIDYTGAKAVPIALREETGFSFSAEEVLSQITDKTRLIIAKHRHGDTGKITLRWIPERTTFEDFTHPEFDEWK